MNRQTIVYEEKTLAQRQAAAVQISMGQQRASKIMQYPAILHEIRERRLDGLQWKAITHEMRQELLDYELARKIEFRRKDYLKTLAYGVVAKAHNDRLKYNPTIVEFKNAIEADPEIKELLMDTVEETGSYAAPLRIAEVRNALTSIGLRPRSISKDDGRRTDNTINLHKYAVANANYIAKVALAEMDLNFDPSIWESEEEGL